ncbi:MAG: hypothetical protein ABR529_09545 [Actinomycetota bacterium]
MTMEWHAPKRRPRLELVSIDGEPTNEERAAVARALERFIDAEREARTPSMWLRAGRARGRRLGMYDYRDRLARDEAWRLSFRFPAGGREHVGRTGRGDSR